MWVIAFECAHFNYTWLFQKSETQRVILDLVRSLDHSWDGTDNINQIVALIVDRVHFSTGLGKLSI